MSSISWKRDGREGQPLSTIDAGLPSPALPLTLPNSHPVNLSTNNKTKINVDHNTIRRGSLDSITDAPNNSQDDGSDLLSAITATFEEKMRNLQESSLTEDESTYPTQEPPEVNIRKTKAKSISRDNPCRLYRDPSLHRRRSSQISVNFSENQVHTSNLNDQINAENFRNEFIKNQISLSKSEKTENNLKEKSEKRIRELKGTDLPDNLREKKPKEMRRSNNENIIGEKEFLKLYSQGDDSLSFIKNTTELRSRRHNVKELKEKFEQGHQSLHCGQSSTPPKKIKSSRKSNKSAIKRRHTVGGTKDLAKQAWIQLIGTVQYNNLSAMIQNLSSESATLAAWEHLQPLITDSKYAADGSLENWLTRERMRTSSPDVTRLLALVLPPFVNEREILHRRLSVRESVLKPLYPVLESHV